MIFKKPIIGYEGLYEVWSDGTIFSVRNNKPLKPFIKGYGYLGVRLWKKCKSKDFKVHRLVAQYFCDNPNGYDEVNHIDEDKTNNDATNLQWCSRKDNCNYGDRNKKISAYQFKRWQTVRSDNE